jgi:hypothetical protein
LANPALHNFELILIAGLSATSIIEWAVHATLRG